MPVSHPERSCSKSCICKSCHSPPTRKYPAIFSINSSFCIHSLVRPFWTRFDNVGSEKEAGNSGYSGGITGRHTFSGMGNVDWSEDGYGHRVVGRRHWRVRRPRRRWCWKSHFRERKHRLRWQSVARWRLIARFTATLTPTMEFPHMCFAIVFPLERWRAVIALKHIRKFCVHVVEVTVQICVFGKAFLCKFALHNTALIWLSVGLHVLTADRLECYL